MANDEYRRVLKTKISELMQLKREQDGSYKKASLKIKELEFELQQERKKVESLQTENEQLLKDLTFEKTQNITIDRELQLKEEALEEQQEKFEKELKERTKRVHDITDELDLAKKKSETFTERLNQIENQYKSEVNSLKNEIRRKDNEFGETRQSYENVAKAATGRHDQCLEFIEIVRREEKNLAPQID